MSFKKRNLRKKGGPALLASEAEDAGDVKAAAVPETNNHAASQKKKPGNTKAGLLSFSDEEAGSDGEDNPFNLAKHSARNSEKTKKRRNKGLAFGGAVATGAATTEGRDAPTPSSLYSKDALEELRQTNKAAAKKYQELDREHTAKLREPSGAADVDDLVIVGGFKPAAPGPPNEVTTAPSGSTTAPVLPDMGSISFGASLSGGVDDRAKQQLLLEKYQGTGTSVSSLPTTDDYGGSQLIPDAATIAKAKAKRERLRQAASAAEDYIPVHGGAGNRDILAEHAGEAKEAASRDGSDSDNEEDTGMDGKRRLQFIGDIGAPSKPGGVLGAAQLHDDSGTAAEDVDDEDAFEREQLGRVMGNAKVDVARTPQNKTPGQIRHNMRLGSQRKSAHGASVAASVEGMAVESLRALDAGVANLNQQRIQLEGDLKRCEQQLRLSQQQVEDIGKALVEESDKYEHVQTLQAYIRELCACLAEKGPLVEELEDHMKKAREERAEAAQKRRTVDYSDENRCADAAVAAVLQVLAAGGDASAARAAANEASANAAEGENEGDGEPLLDEFGRDLNLAHKMERKRRRAQRAKRIAAKQQKREERRQQAVDPQWGPPLAGETSSDESEDEMIAFQSTCREVEETAKANADEQFSQLKVVASKLNEFKIKFPKLYVDAYVGMSVPALFSPYVRLELLLWSPLSSGGEGFFEDMAWYNVLFSYGVDETAEVRRRALIRRILARWPLSVMCLTYLACGICQPAIEDPDANLVPEIIETVVLPLVGHAVRHSWDVTSPSQSQSLAAVVAELMVYLGDGEDGLKESVKELIDQAVQALRAAQKRMIVRCWPPTVTAHAENARLFAEESLGRAIRLVSSISQWDKVVPIETLEAMLGDLLPRCIMPTLHVLAASNPVHALSVMLRVVRALPKSTISKYTPTVEGITAMLQLASTTIAPRLLRLDPDAKQAQVQRMVHLLMVHSNARLVFWVTSYTRDGHV
eukprot:scaffold5101_cov403-Prasinococcus_capsulatus_cf.AAC.1